MTYIPTRFRRSLSAAGPSDGLVVEPFLHVDGDRIYNPLTDFSIPASAPDFPLLLALIERRRALKRVPESVLAHLVEGKWVVADHKNLSSRFYLKYVSLEAHTVCNQGCYFCPVSVAPRPHHFMSMELYESIVEQLAVYRDTIEGVSMIQYNEPTVDKRFVDQVRVLKRYGLPPAVLTNATGLTPPTADAIVEAGGLVFLSINLSTLDDEQYRQDRGQAHLSLVLRHLDYVKDKPLAEQMEIVVLGRGDAQHKNDFADISERFAGTRFEVKYYEVMDRAGYLPVGLKPAQPHQRLCGCEQTGSRPLQWIHITPHGKCVLCCEDYDESYVVGDLTRQTLDEVLAGPDLAQFRRWAYGMEEAPEDFICRGCIYARTR